MSPAAALHDWVFLAYAGLVAGVLLVAGVVLSFVQLVFRIELAKVWSTYRSWLWMAPLAALFVLAGRVPFIFGVTVLGLLGAREFIGLCSLKEDRAMSAAVYVTIAAVGLAALLRCRTAFLPLLAIVLLLLVPIARNRVEGSVRKVSLGALTFLLPGWMLGHLSFLANSRFAYGYVCFVLFATAVTDVAAFTFGKLLGQHPLRSAISPRKTGEGALGALAVAMTLPWLLRFSFPLFGARELILTGLIVGIGGALGDLSLSVLKRDRGAKDWSEAIPGHGGVLDRIDSLIFVAPLFMLMAEYYHPGT